MKFSCTKDNLSKALSIVSGIATKSNNLPILANILIKVDEQKAELIATNLELAVVVNLRSKIEKTGSFTVPGKTLTDFVGLLSDEKIDIELKGSEIIVACGKSSTKIKGSPVDEYPVIPSTDEGQGYLINAFDLSKGLSQVIPAMARTDIRPELSGVFFGFNLEKGNLTIASTDSYRLAEKKMKLEQGVEEKKVIVPGRTAQEMQHILTNNDGDQTESGARILIGESQIVLNFNNVQMVSRLVDGQYPDYTQIIPKEFKTSVLFNTANLSKEVKKASLFTTSGVNAVMLNIKPGENNVKVSSTSAQTGEYDSELSAEIAGEENNVLLNHRYLLDGLNNIGSDMVDFKIINSDSPCMLVPNDDKNYLYIIMPVRQ